MRRGTFTAAFAVILLFATGNWGMAGSPFYLTVDRSFSNTEKAEVRLDFTVSQKPMQLRVLKPQNLEKFLDGQLQISRSYEAPVNELNPGHYFVKGLNKMQSPLKSFRGMLDTKFRKSLQETPLHEALQDTAQVDLATVPEQVIIKQPAGFTKVAEQFIDLEFGGQKANDLGWWFSGSGWDESQYRIRRITLDTLPDGIYLLQAVQGKTEAQCLLQISSLSVQVKQSSEQLVIRVITRQLDPVAGATVRYRDGRGKWMTIAEKTNEAGEIAFNNPEGMMDGKLVVAVETTDQRQALVETDFLPTISNDNAVFVATDRPIFKPGETFFYKGIIRGYTEGSWKLPSLSEQKAIVSLFRADGTPTDLKSTVPLSQFGSFSGSFALDESQVPGLYKLVAEIDKKPYGGELRVRDYVKPTFYLELVDRSPAVVAGDRFFVKFKAKRYSGGVPQGVKFEVFFYRKKFEAPQFVLEAGGGLDAGTDYYGQIRSAAALTEPKRIFSSVEARLAGMGDNVPANTWESAPLLSDNGEGEFSFEVPKFGNENDEWIYSLMVRAMDSSGALAVITDNIFVTLSPAQPAVSFANPVAQVGDKDQMLYVRTTYADGKPAAEGAGVVDLLAEQGSEAPKSYAKLPFTTDAQGFCKIPLPELSAKGRITAIAALETLGGTAMKNPAQSQKAVLVVGGAAGDTVIDNHDLELYTAATILSPGEKSRIFALLPANWGKNETGTIWQTIAGDKVFATKAEQASGRSGWFEVEAKPEYGTGFYQTITVPMAGGKYQEQVLGFRIVPKSKKLELTIHPERDTAEPMKPFRIDLAIKDSDGKPAADTELAVSIVDRAVYAVQGEMRPGIFDFFYPLPRLNLATFYSDDLKGYGYADLLKKPNFQLGALKSQSKLTKKAMRDTAGWFPHVVTDAEGNASIVVDMPANITEWVVTAIASDKGGRVGEARGRYQTVADLSVDMLVPQFLRTGEEAQVQVKAINHLEEEINVKTRLKLIGEAQVKAGTLEEAAELKGKGEQTWPLTLEATGKNGVATVSAALETEAKIHVGGAEEFDIPLKPSALAQVFVSAFDADRLLTDIPEKSKITRVDVQVTSGLLGAALNSAAALVTYPYGCTEQLVHSTIPNLVLLDLVTRAGIKREQLGPLQKILEKAAKNATLGIRKITQKQHADGGFGMWQQDSESSVPVTLMVLSALKFAEDLKVEGVTGAFNRGLGWLSSIDHSAFAENGAISGYQLALASELSSGQEFAQEEIAFVNGLKEQDQISTLDLIHALRIFAANTNKSWSPFNEEMQNAGVKEKLINKLQSALNHLDSGDDSTVEALGFAFQVPTITSAAMGVLQDLNALSPAMEARLKGILLAQQRNGMWISTFDTGQVIFNSRKILSKEAQKVTREKSTHTRKLAVYDKDGKMLGTLDRIPSGFLGSFTNPGSVETLAEMRLEGTTAGEVVRAFISADVPYAEVTPQANGMTVERTFYRINDKKSEEIDLSQPLHVGDIIVSELKVRQHRPTDAHRIPSQFLVIEDGVPSLGQGLEEDKTFLADAGLEAQDSTFWSSIRETQRYPEKTVRIVKLLPGADMKIYQVWRVAFKGRATVPPARAFDMYDDSLQGNSMAKSIEVQ